MVLFICTFDFFDRGLPIYIFENRCEAEPELLMGDDTLKIFVNPYGETTGLSEGTANLLLYIRTQEVSDAFTEELERAVERVRANKEWEVEYMNWRAYEMDMNIEKEEAREEGLAQGIARGRAQGEFAMLLKLVRSGAITIETAAENAGMDREAFLRAENELEGRD